MKITGLITEYNPFHNGHLYHMNRAKEVTGADYCIVLMSGDFVQRGEPAIYDKYVRTSMALLSGADLVLEMPAAFSTASAKEFATYGISLFTKLGAVESVCFGSEAGKIEEIRKAASLLSNESERVSSMIKSGLKNGLTFPEARKQALLAETSEISETSENFISEELFNSPNNILGIEYCRAALQFHSPLKLCTIKREGNGYHDLSTDTVLGSALAIRQALKRQQSNSEIAPLVPPYVMELTEKEIPVFLNDFSALLNYKLLISQPETLERYADVSSDLSDRIVKTALFPEPFENRIQTLKSRQMTYTRISRSLLHILLGITKSEIECYKEHGYASYARILGFRKESAPLLKILKQNSEIPLISKMANAQKILPPAALAMLEQNVRASHIYEAVKKEKGCAFKNEYTQPVIIK